MKVIFRVEEFAYLGKIVTKHERASEDIRSCIKKANEAFVHLHPVWRGAYLFK
jgi:hypothetical protein